MFVSSSKSEQKRVTFASSNGASTSSRTQIGEGLVKNIANTNDKAVKAVLHQIIKLLIAIFYLEVKLAFLIQLQEGPQSRLVQV